MKFQNFKRRFTNEDGGKRKQFRQERESKDFTRFIKTGGKVDVDAIEDLQDEYEFRGRRQK